MTTTENGNIPKGSRLFDKIQYVVLGLYTPDHTTELKGYAQVRSDPPHLISSIVTPSFEDE